MNIQKDAPSAPPHVLAFIEALRAKCPSLHVLDILPSTSQAEMVGRDGDAKQSSTTDPDAVPGINP